MADMSNEQNGIGQSQTRQSVTERNTKETGSVKEQAEYSPPVQPDFLRETIKQKPVNKKKLLRRMAITVVMAVVFGLVACFTFLVLEPVISNRLYPEEEAQEVRFPEETVAEEMKPEDMLVEEEPEPPEEPAPEELVDKQIEEQMEELLSQVKFGLEDYKLLYEAMSELAQKVNRAVIRPRRIILPTAVLGFSVTRNHSSN